MTASFRTAPSQWLPQQQQRSGWQLRAPTVQYAEMVAGWSVSADEAQRWASNPEHPFPASTVTSWWQGPDVQPWLLIDPDSTPAGYGEIWDDADEDEVELARLIVDPQRRRQGIGTLLVDQLLGLARRSGRADCFLRVAPDNTAALALYRSAGFRDVDPTQADAWNQQQPVNYVWLHHALSTDPPPYQSHREDHPMPTISTTEQSSRGMRRLRRTLLVALATLAAAAALTAPTVAAAESGGSPLFATSS